MESTGVIRPIKELTKETSDLSTKNLPPVTVPPHTQPPTPIEEALDMSLPKVPQLQDVPRVQPSIDPYLRDEQGQPIGSRALPEPDSLKLPEILSRVIGNVPTTRKIGIGGLPTLPTVDTQQLVTESLTDRPSQEIADLSRTERQRLERFQELRGDIEDVGKKELEEIERLGKGNIEGETWTGSKKDLERYNKLVEDYQRKVGEFSEEIESTGATIEREETPEGEQLFFKSPEIETVGVGIPGFRKDVPVTEFTAGTGEGIRTQSVFEATKQFGGWIGDTTGAISAKTLTGRTKPSYYGEYVGDIIRDPSILKDKFTFSGEPDVVWDLGSGEARIPTEEDLARKDIVIPPSKVITEEGARAGGKFVGDIGKYAIPYAGAGFFAADIEGEIRDYDYNPISFAKEEPGQAALLGGVLLTAGALRGVKYARTPRILKGSVRGGEVIRLPSTIKGARVSTERGVKNILKFQDRAIRTPVTAYQQTPFQKFLRKEPELVVVQRGQTYVGEPVANIFGKGVDIDKPFLYRFGRVGKKGNIVNERFFKTRVGQKRIDPESIVNLPRRDQYTFEKLFETTKTKSPTKAERIKDIVSEDEFLQKGLTEQIELAKIGTGRATTLTGTGTVVTPVGNLGKGVKTFRIETGAKDVTKPLGRASGKVDVSRDILIQYPTVSAEGTGVQVISGTGKRSSPEFLSKMWQTPKAIQRPDIKKIVSKTPKPSTIVEQATTRPAESIWAGTGLYERTTGGASISQIGESQQTTIQPVLLSARLEQQRIDTTPTTFQDVTPRTFVDLSPRVDTGIDVKLDTIQRPALTLMTETKTDQLPRTLTRQQDRLSERQAIQQATKQRQRLKTGLFTPQKTTTKTPIKTPKPKTPKTPKFKLPLPSKSPSISSLGKGIDEDEFKVFVRKKGEDVKIAEFGTLESARTKLQSELTETLRASGFISKGKDKLGFKDVGLTGSQFRPAKRDKFRIVEKRERRIKKGTGEVTEILKARKGGKKLF